MKKKLLRHSDPSTEKSTGLVGTVYKKTAGALTVRVNGQVYLCKLPRKPAPAAGISGNPKRSPSRDRGSNGNLPDLETLTVGDEVAIRTSGQAEGIILKMLPRRNQLSRRSAVPMPSAHAFEQVVAANLDQVIPVFSAAQPEPKWGMLDRYLVSAEAAEIPAVVCITKIDLIRNLPEEESLLNMVESYRRIGYPIALVSAHTGEGIPEFLRLIAGKKSAFLGKSGVGKTTLLNHIQPDLGLRVNEVSQATGKGLHTTTHLEMFPLEIGGAVVDTPGVREFGLWDVQPEELPWLFPEMRSEIGKCRFGLNCSHVDEPGCSIREAVMRGEISPYRYHSFLRLREEI